MPGKHKNRKVYRGPDRHRGQRLSERERTQVLINLLDGTSLKLHVNYAYHIQLFD
jgi:hypothetical protein